MVEMAVAIFDAASTSAWLQVLVSEPELELMLIFSVSPYLLCPIERSERTQKVKNGLLCRWDKYLPSRSKEASGRAAEWSAKQQLHSTEQPLMPLLLRPNGVSSDAVSQEMSSMRDSQWRADTITELKALELKGQRMQHAVIGQPHVFLPAHCAKR